MDHIVSKERIGLDPEKIKAIVAASFPTIKRGIRAFLGLTGYYRRFIHCYAMIAKPLTRFLKNDSTLTQATPDALEALGTLKQSLLSAQVLRTPD